MSTYAEEARKATQEVKKEVDDKANEASNSQAAKDAKKNVDDIKSKAKEGLENAKTVVNETINGVKKDLPKYKEEALKKEKEIADKLKKDYDQSKSFLVKVYNNLSEKVSEAGAYVSTKVSNFAVVAKEELKNPVVLSQTVITFAAVPAVMVGIQERSKIFGGKTDSEITLILTGLISVVALDCLIFNKLYPKYDKKSKKL